MLLAGSCAAGACLFDDTTVSKSYNLAATTAVTYSASDKSVNMQYNADGDCKVSLKFLCPTSPSEVCKYGMATTLPHCNFSMELTEILIQNHNMLSLTAGLGFPR